jgi:pyruvate dehydrogenase E2 component (dihydrolipoamide acetyltransferase)
LVARVKTIVMPSLDEIKSEGKIVDWLKNEGDMVRKGEPIVTIETVKVTYDVPSPATGTLYRRMIDQGTTVPVGRWLGVIMEEGDRSEDIEAEIARYAATVLQGIAETATQAVSVEVAPVAQTRMVRRQRASPRARRVAAEMGVDTALVQGTGPGELITEADIKTYVERAAIGTGTRRISHVIPMTSTRKTIAENVMNSLSSMAQVTITRELDASSLVAAYQRLRGEVEKTAGIKLTYTAMIVKAVGKVLREQPVFNAMLDGDEIRIFEETNIGVATAVDKGLVVPVIKDVDKKRLEEVAREMDTLVDKARSGRLSPSDVDGGTFTVTNLGMYGVGVFTPIISPRQVAILGVGSIVEKPIVVRKAGVASLDIRPTVVFSLTFDHRVVDGHAAAQFLSRLADLVESFDELGG